MNKENKNRLILDPPCKFRQAFRAEDQTLIFICRKSNKKCPDREENVQMKGKNAQMNEKLHSWKEKCPDYEPMERATARKEREQKEAAQRIGYRIGQMIVYYSFSVLFLAALAVIFDRPISFFRIVIFVAVLDFLQEFHDFCFKTGPKSTF